ncbi:MAG: MFS transporter [Clostridiales bacterium]|jgi:MFS family permease|nr:MFS transporter [Clostridiales bacterium]
MNNKSYRISLFCLVTGLYWFSLYAYVPILSPYAESLGASYKMVGTIIGSYGFTQMVLRIPLGVLSDKLGKRKPFIVLGIGISLLSSLGMYFFKNPLMILLFRSLSGVAASSWVAYTILFSSYFEQGDASKALGIVNACNSLGQMSAVLIGGYAAQRLGQNTTFIIASVSSALGLALSFGIVEKKKANRKPLDVPELLTVAGNRGLLVVSGLAILLQFIAFSTVYGFTPVIAKKIGANDAQLGLLTAFSSLPAIFSSAVSGSVFSKRFGEKKVIAAGFVIISASCAAIPLISNINILYLSQIIGGLGRGLVFPLLMSLCIKSIDRSKHATAMGFFQAIYGVGMFIGPVITGFINDAAKLFWGFWVSAAVGLAGALIANQFIKEEK